MEKSELTAGIFATYPRPGISLFQAFSNEVIGTFLLILCVKSVTDKNNRKPADGLEPVLIGLSVFTIGASIGTVFFVIKKVFKIYLNRKIN
jgi:glycerol uptake facilitator-like aquaporin